MRKTGPREADNRAGTMPDKEYPLLVLVYITRRPDFKKRMSELKSRSTCINSAS